MPPPPAPETSAPRARPCPSPKARLWDNLLNAAELRARTPAPPHPHDFTFAPRQSHDSLRRDAFEDAVINQGLQVFVDFDLPVNPPPSRNRKTSAAKRPVPVSSAPRQSSRLPSHPLKAPSYFPDDDCLLIKPANSLPQTSQDTLVVKPIKRNQSSKPLSRFLTSSLAEDPTFTPNDRPNYDLFAPPSRKLRQPATSKRSRPRSTRVKQSSLKVLEFSSGDDEPDYIIFPDSPETAPAPDPGDESDCLEIVKPTKMPPKKPPKKFSPPASYSKLPPSDLPLIRQKARDPIPSTKRPMSVRERLRVDEENAERSNSVFLSGTFRSGPVTSPYPPERTRVSKTTASSPRNSSSHPPSASPLANVVSARARSSDDGATDDEHVLIVTSPPKQRNHRNASPPVNARPPPPPHSSRKPDLLSKKGSVSPHRVRDNLSKNRSVAKPTIIDVDAISDANSDDDFERKPKPSVSKRIPEKVKHGRSQGNYSSYSEIEERQQELRDLPRVPRKKQPIPSKPSKEIPSIVLSKDEKQIPYQPNGREENSSQYKRSRPHGKSVLSQHLECNIVGFSKSPVLDYDSDEPILPPKRKYLRVPPEISFPNHVIPKKPPVNGGVLKTELEIELPQLSPSPFRTEPHIYDVQKMVAESVRQKERKTLGIDTFKPQPALSHLDRNVPSSPAELAHMSFPSPPNIPSQKLAYVDKNLRTDGEVEGNWDSLLRRNVQVPTTKPISLNKEKSKSKDGNSETMEIGKDDSLKQVDFVDLDGQNVLRLSSGCSVDKEDKNVEASLDSIVSVPGSMAEGVGFSNEKKRKDSDDGIVRLSDEVMELSSVSKEGEDKSGFEVMALSSPGFKGVKERKELHAAIKCENSLHSDMMLEENGARKNLVVGARSVVLCLPLRKAHEATSAAPKEDKSGAEVVKETDAASLQERAMNLLSPAARRSPTCAALTDSGCVAGTDDGCGTIKQLCDDKRADIQGSPHGKEGSPGPEADRLNVAEQKDGLKRKRESGENSASGVEVRNHKRARTGEHHLEEKKVIGADESTVRGLWVGAVGKLEQLAKKLSESARSIREGRHMWCQDSGEAPDSGSRSNENSGEARSDNTEVDGKKRATPEGRGQEQRGQGPGMSIPLKLQIRSRR